ALGKSSAALQDLSRAIAQARQEGSPTAPALTARGELQLERKKASEALDDFSAALEEAPTLGAAILGKSTALLVLGRSKEAEQVATDWLDRPNSSPAGTKTLAALYLRAQARHATGDYAGAEADLSLLIGLNPKSADAHYNRGLARIGLGDLDGATKDLEAASALTPQADAAHALARTRIARGQIDDAMAIWIERRSLADDDERLQRGLLLMSLGQNQDAADVLEPLDKDPAAQVRFVEALVQAGRIDDAMRRAQGLSLRHPKDPRLLLLEAETTLASGAADRAQFALDRAIDLGAPAARSKSVEGQIALVRAEKVRGVERERRLREAVNAFEAALAAGASPVQLIPRRARALEGLGQLETAKIELDEAIAAAPDAAAIRFMRAAILRKLGRCEEAIRDYDVALRLDPSNSEAQAMRGRCELEGGAYFDGIGDLIGSWR
ncbi:MAG: tetratricopeptide repeat protein, partial [Pseudomonadota bacterium]